MDHDAVQVQVCLPVNAARVWTDRYAQNPDTAAVKLELGHQAFERATRSDAAQMAAAFSTLLRQVQQDLSPQTEVSKLVRTEAEAQKQLFLHAMGQQNEIINLHFESFKAVQAAKQKQSTKGAAAEDCLVQDISSLHGFRAQKLGEKDAQGRIGGDLICSDAHGHGMMIEVKDKAKINAADLLKFVRDVDQWAGTEQMFCFLVQNGIGSSRKLIEKPEVELTAKGQVVFWFRDGAAQFLQRLPYMMACGARMLSCTSSQELELNAQKQAVLQGLSALRQTSKELQQSEIVLAKEISSLQKRRASVDAVVRSMQCAAAAEDLSSTTKKRKTVNVTTATEASCVKQEDHRAAVV